MVTETITIPKQEYKLLLKCRHIVESDFEVKFSKKFIKALKESEKAYKKGEFIRFKNAKEAKAYFDKI